MPAKWAIKPDRMFVSLAPCWYIPCWLLGLAIPKRAGVVACSRRLLGVWIVL